MDAGKKIQQENLEMKNTDPGLLSNLPTYADEGSVHAVVEAPKGSGVKFKYDEKLRAFTVTRALPLGLTYPFDWGFVPSTKPQTVIP
jgi:inorganic pyrophosphatase